MKKFRIRAICKNWEGWQKWKDIATADVFKGHAPTRKLQVYAIPYYLWACVYESELKEKEKEKLQQLKAHK